MKIAIVTDSSCGISPLQKEYKNLFVIPIPFTMEKKEYLECVNITNEEFYAKMNPEVDCHTSQTPLGEVSAMWDKALKEYDHVIHIPISSGLSQACENALMFAKDEYEGKVTVINNQRVSITLKGSILDALEMISENKTLDEIVQYLNESKLKAGIYIYVDTLTYLKKGGRITPAAAALGTLINLKPILTIQGGKLDAYKKVISGARAKKELIEALRKQMTEQYLEDYENGNLYLGVAHSNDLEGATEVAKKMKEAFPKLEVKFIDPLSLAVAIHTGPKAIGVGFIKKR